MKYIILFVLFFVYPLYVIPQGLVTKTITKNTAKSLVKGKVEKSCARGIARRSVAIGFKKSTKSSLRYEAKSKSINKLSKTRNSTFSGNVKYGVRVPKLNHYKSRTDSYIISSVFHNGFKKYDYSELIKKNALVFKKSPETIQSNIANEFCYWGKYKNKAYSKEMLEEDFVKIMDILKNRINELYYNMDALNKFDDVFMRGKQRYVLFDERSFAHVFGRHNNDFEDKSVNEVFDLIIDTLKNPRKIEINANNNYMEYTGSKYKVVLNNQNRFVTMFRYSKK